MNIKVKIIYLDSSDSFKKKACIEILWGGWFDLPNKISMHNINAYSIINIEVIKDIDEHDIIDNTLEN
jgi:hypothetical protein